jgi:protein-export membrane protein SecD
MTRAWWYKFSLLVIVTVFSVAYLVPTVRNLDTEKTSYPFKQKINLGLDLQGGVYMVLGVDFNKVFGDVTDRLADNLFEDMQSKKIGCQKPTVKKVDGGKALDDPRVVVECNDKDAKEALHKLVKSEDSLRITGDTGNSYEFALSKVYKDNVREKTLNQSIEVIRNRIDEFGVTEPVITSQGTERLSVELPGIKDVERAKELIGRTAKLEFKIVADDKMTPDEVAALVSQIEVQHGVRYKEGDKFSEYVAKINEHAQGKVPAGTVIAFEREEQKGAAGEGERFSRVPYLLYSRADVTGDDLKDAFIQIDPQDNRPEVGLSFNAQGADKFDKVTTENVRKRMAIVLDGIVHSAPVIQTRIAGGRAQITLGQGDYNDLLAQARDLSIVLRAGALPAQLEFLEQRIVGPSLGADSIEKGKFASLVGCLAIFIFMLIYYRISGFIADVTLVMNLIFVMAILVGLEATLTLPGIAGIALTIGIAVDSNVIIYERIREELRIGKSAKTALDAGFNKAFTSLLDSNLTNAVAAIVLLNFGTGPIKGFAVTLLIGVVTTLFTAVFATRVLMDLYVEKFKVKEMSI